MIHNKSYYAFDLGDVLVEFNSGLFFQKLGKFQWIYQYLIDGQYHRQYEIGVISLQEICKDLFERNNKIYNESDILEIIRIWNDSIYINKEMISFYHKLYNREFSKDYFALLSNIGKEHSELILNNEPILKESIHHFSYEVGARKPSKLYYQSFLMSNPQFKNCLYLDDRIENVKMAKHLGFKSYYFSLTKFKRMPDNHKDNLLKLIYDYKSYCLADFDNEYYHYFPTDVV